MIYTTIDNFYVTEEQLEDSPSRKDGISREVEHQLRIYGCEIIQEGGVLLKLPQAVMATGQVLLQRFYCKESLLKYNIKRVAWACCWLATKLEESPRRVRDVLSVFIRIDRRRDGKGDLTPLDFYSQEYVLRKGELIKVERHLLRTFGFILHVDHPHKVILNYLNLLKVSSGMKQEAWNLANDSLRTTLCVRFRGEVIACGLILLASLRKKEKMPDNPSWLELFEVEKKDVYTVAREVQALYSMPKVSYISVYKEKQIAQAGQNPNRTVPPSMNATPQPSDSDIEMQKPKDEKDIVEISGTSAEQPLSSSRGERMEKEEDQRSAQKSGQSRPRSEEEKSSRHYRRNHDSHTDSEDDRSERRRSRSRSRSRDYDRSRERKRREARSERFGRDDDRRYRDRRERYDRDYRYRDRDHRKR